MVYFEVNKKPRLTFPTLTGSICTFNSQYAGLPLKSHTIALTATQSGSGTPSPQNIRSINGHSVIGVSATGKNLLRITKAPVETINGITYTTNDDNSISISGEFTKLSLCIVSNLVSLKAGTYILTGCPSGGSYSNYVLRLEDSSNVLIALDTGNGVKFTTTKDQFVYCRIYIYSQNGVGKTFYPMVRLVDTEPDYEPYNGIYTTITIGSTVYGGEYDARTGVLTVTHKGVLWSDLTIQLYNGNIYQANVSDILRPTSEPERQQGIMSSNIKVCSTFAVNETMEDLSMLKLTDYVYIKISSASTATEAQAILGSGQLVYELATPIDIQLPPCPIDTLEGVNNVWADTGDTTLQYPKFG